MKKHTNRAGWFAPYREIRSDSYVMLASLLSQPPSESHLLILQNLHWEGPIPEKLHQALETMCRTSRDYPLSALEDEYGKLFVGPGSGGMVPYASWYRERKIQSSPLAALRSDLLKLGIVRQSGCHEAEDHAGSLCECMAIISRKSDGMDIATQGGFFQQHIQPWMTAFFKDLESAKGARFYRTVGRFGRCFMESETEYLTDG